MIYYFIQRYIFGGVFVISKSNCALICCSNGIKITETEKIDLLENRLKKIFADVITGKYIYSDNGTVSSASAEKKAKYLTQLFKSGVTNIFDISGGDICNEILPYLDYDIIKKSQSVFWGYSDLTAVINAIYTLTGKASVLYQIKNIIGTHRDLQLNRVCNYLNGNSNELFEPEYTMLNGSKMNGIVVGGNIRCFLKLAGTIYFPDLSGKILLLEAFSGDEPKIRTYLAHLIQLGAFEKINGIILGTFTYMEKNHTVPTVEEIVLDITNYALPVAKTCEIGHGNDSKAIFIGKEITI